MHEWMKWMNEWTHELMNAWSEMKWNEWMKWSDVKCDEIIKN